MNPGSRSGKLYPAILDNVCIISMNSESKLIIFFKKRVIPNVQHATVFLSNIMRVIQKPSSKPDSYQCNGIFSLHVSCIGRWILCHWVPGKPFDIITFTLFLFSKIEIIVGTQYMLRDFSLRAGWVGYTGMWSLVKQWKVHTFPFVLPILFFSNTSCYQI